MPHSNLIKRHWLFVIAEVVLFVVASVSVYFSQVSAWSGYIALSIVATLLFATIKIIEAIPRAKELWVHEDMASNIASAAEPCGVREYFNMQSAKGQTHRNEVTQREIERANYFSLCANSGASYLDPAVYRHWPFIERRLERGAEFRVVLLDPFSEAKAFRNSINPSGMKFDSKVNIENLIRLYNTYKGLEIKFARNGMHATVFATENCAFFDPYQMCTLGDRIENRSFSLRIEPTEPTEGVGLYSLFKGHFNTLWQSGMDLPDWLLEYKNQIPAGLSKIKERQ